MDPVSFSRVIMKQTLRTDQITTIKRNGMLTTNLVTQVSCITVSCYEKKLEG